MESQPEKVIDVIRKRIDEIRFYQRQSENLLLAVPVSFNIYISYDVLFKKWFKIQREQLIKRGLLAPCDNDFIEHCWIYARAIALKFKEAGITEINFEYDELLFEEGELERWVRFFGQDKLTLLTGLACPWKVQKSGILSLYNKEIVNYFAGLAEYDLKEYLGLPFIRGDEGLEQLSEMFDREVLTVNGNQLSHFIADILTGDVSREDCFRLVHLSCKNEKFSRIAANAITVLNAARVPFSGMDLSHISIPRAWLRGAICYQTNFKYANLTGVTCDQSILTCAQLQNAKLTDLKLLQLPELNIEGVEELNVAFNKDLSYVVMADRKRYEGRVELWSLKTRKCLQAWRDTEKSLSSIGISADGQRIMAASDDKVILYNVHQSKRERIVDYRYSLAYGCAVLSSDGEFFAVGFSSFTVAQLSHHIHLYSWEEEKPVYQWDFPSGYLVKKLAISGNGQRVACIFSGNTGIHLFERGYKEPRQIFSKGENFFTLQLNHNGTRIASGGDDKNVVKLWLFGQDLPLFEWHGHANTVMSLSLSEDGNSVVSGSKDTTVRFWTVGQVAPLHIWQRHVALVSRVKLSHDGRYVASVSRDHIKLHIVDHAAFAFSPNKGHTHLVSSIAFSANGQYFLSGSLDCTAKLWSCGQSQLLHTWKLPRAHNSTTTVALSQDASWLVTGSEDGKVHLWKKGESHPQRTWDTEQKREILVAMSFDGQWIASLSYRSGLVQLWQQNEDSPVSTWDTNFDGESSFVWLHPNGEYILTGHSDDKHDNKKEDAHLFIIRWERDKEPKLIWECTVSKKSRHDLLLAFTGIAFCLAQKTFVTIRSDGLISLWKENHFQPFYELDTYKIYDTRRFYWKDARLSNDGQYITAAYISIAKEILRESFQFEGIITVFDVKTSKPLADLYHPYPIITFDYTQNAQGEHCIVSGCYQGLIFLWKSKDGKNWQLNWSSHTMDLFVNRLILDGAEELSETNFDLFHQLGAVGYPRLYISDTLSKDAFKISDWSDTDDILPEYTLKISQRFPAAKLSLKRSIEGNSAEALSNALIQAFHNVKQSSSKPMALDYLDLSGLELDDQSMRLLASAVQGKIGDDKFSLQQCRVLILSSNKITHSGLLFLLEALAEKPCVRQLLLDRNRISFDVDYYKNILVNLIERAELVNLDLSMNFIAKGVELCEMHPASAQHGRIEEKFVERGRTKEDRIALNIFRDSPILYSKRAHHANERVVHYGEQYSGISSLLAPDKEENGRLINVDHGKRVKK